MQEGSGATTALKLNSDCGGTNKNKNFIIDTNGNVGIGTTSPDTKLEVAGQIKITGGSPGAGKVLTSDANGLASWQTGSTYGFGGIYIIWWHIGYSGCEGANPITGDCSCPSGYMDSQLGTIEGDRYYYIHMCWH